MDRLGKELEVGIVCLALCMCMASCGGDEEGAGFEKMPPPKPGDWLYVRKEKGQTFEQYKSACLNRKTKNRNTIYIQPLGSIATTPTMTSNSETRRMALLL